MNKKGIGIAALIAMILGLLVIGLVIFQYPKLKTFFDENILGVKPERKIEGTSSRYVDITVPLSSDYDEAVKQLADQTIYCWKEFERSGFTDQVCAKIVPAPAISKRITETAYSTKLSNSGSLGEDISGSGYFDRADYFWNIGTIGPGDEPFWICADDDGRNEVGFTRNTEGGDCH